MIAAALSLADVTGTARLWRQRRVEFSISVAAFLGVALLGVLPGIAVAVVLSILNVFRRAWWPYQTRLGRVDGTARLPRRDELPAGPAARRPGAVPVRRAALLRQRPDLPRRDPQARDADPQPRWIVVAAEPITDVDTTAADVLEELDDDTARTRA